MGDMGGCNVFTVTILTLCQCISSYKHVIFMHGLLGSASEFTQMQQWLEKAHPNTTTTLINAYKRLGSLEPMWHQVKSIRSQMSDIMKTHREGVHLLCFSQGGLICRAVLETLPDHNVENFISLSCPQGDTTFLRKFFPHYVRDNIYLLFYSKYGQDFSVGNYWNDPYHQPLYRNYSDFLAILNNDTYNSQSEAYKTSFTRLKNLVLIGGPDDGVIAPWQSSLTIPSGEYVSVPQCVSIENGTHQFGAYDKQMRVVPMDQQPKWFGEDSFGLRTLHKRGAVHNYTVAGIKHFDWHRKEAVFQKYIVQWLS